MAMIGLIAWQMATTSTSSEAAPEDCTPGPSPESILSKLKSPQLSDLSRKRKVATNQPPKGAKKSKGRNIGDPKSVSPSERLKQFPEECFKVSNNNLFCTACREPLSIKKSVIEGHIKSSKHIKGKDKLASKETRERDISEMLTQYDSRVHPVGETLPTSIRVYRVRTVTAFLKSGVALNKIDSFRDLLEENGLALSSSQHLRELIPPILCDERRTIGEEIAQRPVSLIYDGTTHVAEALVVILRFVDDHWTIQQRVVRLMLLAKSVTGEELAREIISILSTQLQVHHNLLVASMRDRASVNNVAMRTVRVLYSKLFDIGCFSHTLDHVGEKFNTPVLKEFTSAWISLFSRSPKNKLAWKSQTDQAIRTHSNTRWWSRWEVMKQIHDLFGDVERFVASADLSPAAKLKLQNIMTTPSLKSQLMVKLAITIDAGEPFIKATYFLEGDGPLVFSCYERIQALRVSVSTAYYPNTSAVINKVAHGNPVLHQQFRDYAEQCVKPGHDYFESKFQGDLKQAVQLFKAARYFDPCKAIELKPTCCDLDALRAFPCLDEDAIIDGLKSELPQYMASSEDVSPTVSRTDWWSCHESELPNWSKAAKLSLLFQPSSAAAERVFSLLQNSFNEQQYSSLEDYIEASVMLQYNRS